MNPRDQAQVVRHGGRCLYLLSFLTGQDIKYWRRRWCCKMENTLIPFICDFKQKCLDNLDFCFQDVITPVFVYPTLFVAGTVFMVF